MKSQSWTEKSSVDERLFYLRARRLGSNPQPLWEIALFCRCWFFARMNWWFSIYCQIDNDGLSPWLSYIQDAVCEHVRNKATSRRWSGLPSNYAGAWHVVPLWRGMYQFLATAQVVRRISMPCVWQSEGLIVAVHGLVACSSTDHVSRLYRLGRYPMHSSWEPRKVWTTYRMQESEVDSPYVAFYKFSKVSSIG